jgi:hypothetical protein
VDGCQQCITALKAAQVIQVDGIGIAALNLPLYQKAVQTKLIGAHQFAQRSLIITWLRHCDLLPVLPDGRRYTGKQTQASSLRGIAPCVDGTYLYIAVSYIKRFGLQTF